MNPTYLWALLGLLIPIVIHLWSKKEGKTIKIGSIQLLSEADSKQNSSIKLNELILLLIRMLLIALVVLIIAQPQIKKDFENTKLTYLVEPSLLNNKSITNILDTITANSSIKLLQRGFPELNLSNIPNEGITTPNYWQLTQEIDDLHSDSIIVFTNGLLKGLKGKRPIINTNVDWIIIDNGATTENIIKATKKNESVELLSIISNSESLSFKKEILPLGSNNAEFSAAKDSVKINDLWLPTETIKPLNVLIYNDEDFDKETMYIDASFKAISKYINVPIETIIKEDITSIAMSNYNYVVWLSEQQPIEAPEVILVYKPDTFASSLIEESDTKNLFYLTKTLDSESIVNKHLPEQLISTLDLHSNLKDSILKNDKRIVAKEEIHPIFKDIETKKSYASVLDISKWLWLLLASLLVIERIVANFRKQ
ncbi:BatA domain-containing protein [Flavobacteriaceae bacterium S0825]|uniref:BatA domain-containing protein n=1 Tax=Gaetbulibacter sp. S0825 TaxID=2720084 RepID=UPI0014321845|nr:BatA domain-containing protein [Gaetbulibacter sp. S0825]MCK0107758.1 BatA domain-containing protein [Flavobacteriaceae bacterium S0825]NIX63394.1 hypothetical protein [Gaetbulibacter sp. S0825]